MQEYRGIAQDLQRFFAGFEFVGRKCRLVLFDVEVPVGLGELDVGRAVMDQVVGASARVRRILGNYRHFKVRAPNPDGRRDGGNPDIGRPLLANQAGDHAGGAA